MEEPEQERINSSSAGLAPGGAPSGIRMPGGAGAGESAATRPYAGVDEVDLATEASLEEDSAASGPLARPRGRRLLFGGLTSGPAPSGPAPSGPFPAAFNEKQCYCQKIDYPVPTSGG